MFYDYAKTKIVDAVPEGASEYNVIRIGAETIEELEAKRQHYMANGYEICSRDEYEAQFPAGEAPSTDEVAVEAPVEEAAAEVIEEVSEPSIDEQVI